jgi:peptidoglycan/xylan/chitin deacetylase (PgdA/CDA1 family)
VKITIYTTLRIAGILISIMALLLGPLMPAAASARTAVEESASSSVKPNKQPNRKQPALSWDKLHQQFPQSFLLHGPRNRKQVALTFDDAPDSRFTPAILDILAKHHVCATFFVVGARALQQPAIVQRIHREGHVIGNHSYDHAVLSRLPLAQYRKQISHTDAIINRLVGYTPHFIRPPYGELLPVHMKWSQAAGYVVVNWDVDSVDWRNNPSSASIIRNIRKTLQPGSIVLQHAGGGTGQSLTGTIEALPQLIELLRSKGYELVTLPELIGQPAAKQQ